jgi:hypothetical protein
MINPENTSLKVNVNREEEQNNLTWGIIVI